MAASKAEAARFGGITPNSPLTASPPAPTLKKGRIFLAASFTMGILSRARYVRKIFSAPLRTERERKYGFSIHFQFLGPAPWERESRTIRARGLFLRWRRDPPLPSYSVPLSLRIASSILPSFSSRIMRELVFLSVSLISKDNNVLIRL